MRISEDVNTTTRLQKHNNTYMLFTRREVRMVKTVPEVLDTAEGGT